MATKTVNGFVQNKSGPAANWKEKNIILLLGEIGIETDTNRIKIGDGVTAWNNLPYFGVNTGSLFEIDINGGLMPLETSSSSEDFEYDTNGDVMPKEV